MNNEDKILQMLENLTNKFDSLEAQVKENTQILKALEHNSQVHKSEMDNINYRLAEISGDVKSIKLATVKGEKAYNFLQNFSKFNADEQH